MPHSIKDVVLKMVQKEDENLEDFIKRFVYNIKREKMNNLDEETLKALLLKSIKDKWIDLLNIMGKGDISQLPFVHICDLCVHISRGKVRARKSSRDPLLSRVKKSAVETVSRTELGSLLNNFKIYILGSLSEILTPLKYKTSRKPKMFHYPSFVLGVERNML